MIKRNFIVKYILKAKVSNLIIYSNTIERGNIVVDWIIVRSFFISGTIKFNIFSLKKKFYFKIINR